MNRLFFCAEYSFFNTEIPSEQVRKESVKKNSGGMNLFDPRALTCAEYK